MNIYKILAIHLCLSFVFLIGACSHVPAEKAKSAQEWADEQERRQIDVPECVIRTDGSGGCAAY